VKGRDDSFGHMGSRRGVTPPKDEMVHDGDLWSPYKRTRVQQPRKEYFEDKERKKSSMALMKTKRASSLKEPSHSTWKDLCYLEVDWVERVGRDFLGTVLGKFGNTSLLEACVR
jgi:hypothetical protein